jgi:hypothetical protein
MEPILEALNHRLEERGIASEHIPAFFRNFSHSFSAASETDPQQVRMEMERLGWDEFELDNYTFELMVYALESS